MQEAATEPLSTPRSPVSLAKPLIAFALPFLLCIPYRWFVFQFASRSVVTPHPEEEHRQFHLFFFWALSYLPFALVCLFTSLVMAARRVRQERRALWWLVPAGVCTVAVLGLLVVIVLGL